MREKCFDEGTIQAFMDGELSPDLLEQVARHVALCDECAISLAQAEEETAVAFSALEREFNTLVPTQRLWTKINESIESNKKTSVWQPAWAYFLRLKTNLSNPSVAAFASLVIFAGLVAVVYEASDWSQQVLNRPIPDVTAVNDNFIARAVIPPIPEIEKEPVSEPAIERISDQSRRNQSKADRIYNAPKPQPVTVAYLPGEESYVKTISTLEKTIDGQKDEVLKPSARFEYERDLAITNDAIRKMKAEVKKNPKNEGAKQILFASYQNKIDLLNSVVGKTELIASIR